MKNNQFINVCCTAIVVFLGVIVFRSILAPQSAHAAMNGGVEYSVIDYVDGLRQNPVALQNAFNQAVQHGWRVKSSVGGVVILER